MHIYDDKDGLVAEDKGGGEYVAVIWYPHAMQIHNPGVHHNVCYISLK